MQKILLIGLFISLLHFDTKACDICGCGNGGSFFGVLPQSHIRLMGLRYKYKSFQSHVNSAHLKAEENFRSMELWGRLYPLPKTQLLFFAPLNFNTQTRLADSKSSTLNGLGDLTVLMHYNVVNTVTDTNRIHKVDHNLLLGGGIKTPMGKYQFDNESVEEVANANFQLGTGSWDFPINVIYTAKRKDYGLNLNATYKINGTNANEYKFANRFNASVSVFKLIAVKSFILMPLVGIYGEKAKQDTYEGKANEFTGGGFIAGNVGMDFYLGKNSIGLNTQVPFLQNLSNGDLKIQNSFNFQLTRMF